MKKLLNTITVAITLLVSYNNGYTDEPDNVKILSLDGGGTRGYIQAKFLSEFFGEDTDLSTSFDLIAGTSVGGINAVAIAEGKTPKDMMNFYRKETPWIFTIRSTNDIFSINASVPSLKPSSIQTAYMIGVSDPIYKSVSTHSNYGDAKLRRTITEMFGDKKLTGLTTTNVLLTAHNYSEYAPVIFTNANIEGIPDTFKEVKIVDALMATTSTPVYFPSTKLKLSDTDPEYSSIVDGGLFQNNPSSLAFSAAKKLYPNATSYSLLSIGAGIRKIGLHFSSNERAPGESSIAKYTELCDMTMTNAEIDNDVLFKSISNNKDSNINYYRFNIKLDSSVDYSFDTSTKEYFDYLDKLVADEYNTNDEENIDKFKKAFYKVSAENA